MNIKFASLRAKKTQPTWKYSIDSAESSTGYTTKEHVSEAPSPFVEHPDPTEDKWIYLMH